MTRERWTVRWRLTVWNSAVLTLLFCLFSVAMLYAVHGHLAYKADQVLKEELFALQEEVQRYTDDSETLSLVLQRRYATHAAIHFQILDQDFRQSPGVDFSKILSCLVPPIRFKSKDKSSRISTCLRESFDC